VKATATVIKNPVVKNTVGKKKAAQPEKGKSARTAASPPVSISAKKGTAAPAKSAKAEKAAARREAPPPEPKGPSAEELLQARIDEALANLAYREGSFVVHPKYGVGRVQRLVDRRLTLRTVPCLEIHFSHHDMKLTIPVDQVDRSGLRAPIQRRDVDGVFQALRGRATFDTKRRSAKRVADYQKRVRQGDPLSLAEVVRDLSRLSLRKTLSYEERKILNEALRILSREVALVRNREPDEVRRDIEAIVNR